MRNIITFTLSSLIMFLSAVSNSHATFIQPTSISTTASPTINTPAVLINAATGNGGTNYIAPGPASGGGGTSWYTSDNGTSPVILSFDFAATTDLFSELYLWDYYTHSPSDWTLKLYSGLGATGTELLNLDFAISPGIINNTSTKHIIDFADVSGVLSGVLQTRNNSTNGGVGLAEIGFTAFAPPPVPAPEPSSLLLLSLGMLGIVKVTRCRGSLARH